MDWTKLSIYLDENGRRRDTDPEWFTDHVPLWATSASQGKRVSVRHWSACDVPHSIDGREIVDTITKIKIYLFVLISLRIKIDL